MLWWCQWIDQAADTFLTAVKASIQPLSPLFTRKRNSFSPKGNMKISYFELCRCPLLPRSGQLLSHSDGAIMSMISVVCSLMLYSWCLFLYKSVTGKKKQIKVCVAQLIALIYFSLCGMKKKKKNGKVALKMIASFPSISFFLSLLMFSSPRQIGG